MLQRVRAEVGYEYGDRQLGQLQLAELTLAHEAHEKQQGKIYDKRPDNYNRQVNHPDI